MSAPQPPAAVRGGCRRRRAPITAADFADSIDAARATAAVIGVLLLAYVVGHALGALTSYLGWLLYAAANGLS